MNRRHTSDKFTVKKMKFSTSFFMVYFKYVSMNFVIHCLIELFVNFRTTLLFLQLEKLREKCYIVINLNDRYVILL